METLLREITKLNLVRDLNLPSGLFDDMSPRIVEAWRARATRAYRSDLAGSSQPVRLTLIGVLCSTRRTEITDALVDLLLGLVHKINTHADRRVERELIADLRRVRGKDQILFRIAEVAVERPDDKISDVVYPVVDERTLRDLVREARAEERLFNDRVRTVLRSSYSSYYRRMLSESAVYETEPAQRIRERVVRLGTNRCWTASSISRSHPSFSNRVIAAARSRSPSMRIVRVSSAHRSTFPARRTGA